MKRKNFNFDVMQSKASEGIKLTPMQNEYALNCYEIIFGKSHEEEELEKDNENKERLLDSDQEAEEDEEEYDPDSKLKGALWTFLLSVGVTLVGILLLVI